MRKAAAVLLPLRLASCAHGDPGADSTAYSCNPAYTIEAAYHSADDHSTQFADLKINGARYQLRLVQSASGARYAAEMGLTPDYSLIWHTKGSEALLLQAPLDHTVRAGQEELLASCRASVP